MEIEQFLVKTKPSWRARLARQVVKRYLAPRFAPASTPEMSRRAVDRIARLGRTPRGTAVEKLEIAGRPAEWVRGPGVEDGGRTIFYIHGGGLFSGSPATHRDLAVRLSRLGGARVLLPDYRLAPENRYPAANEDCLAAYRWLIESGADPAKTLIGGDSAGGYLALMTLVSLKEAGDPLPAGAFFLSPLTDGAIFDGESMKTRAAADPWFDPSGVPAHLRRYTAGIEPTPPILSPTRMDLAGLPPLFIQLGNDEILLSDSVRLAERAREGGVEVEIEIWEHMWHVFQTFAVAVPEAREALERMGAFIRKRLGG